MSLVLLLLQEAKLGDAPNPMGVHTWFIILAVGSFLAWSISYSLQLQKEALAKKKGREDLVHRRDELLDKIVDLEARKEAGTLAEQKYKQELKDLKFRLSKVVENLRKAAERNTKSARST